MTNKNTQELIDLYKSGEILITKRKIIQEIKKEPNNFFLYDFLSSLSGGAAPRYHSSTWGCTDTSM